MDTTEERRGLAYGFTAYVLWGLFPLYFVLFKTVGAMEVAAHRALWTLAFCVSILALTKSWRSVRAIFANRKLACGLIAAGVLIVVNWTIYIYGVNTERTIDAALGYFINPLAVTLLGVVVLGERLRPLQWGAFALGTLAVIVLLAAYGQFPWIALTLAGSFGTYSLVKKIAGAAVAPLPGLTVETLAILPASTGYLIYLAVVGQSSASGVGQTLLLASSGVVTAVPLLLFAAAARRVRLVTIGMVQYLAPIGQFLVGWLVFAEPMPGSRWAGFALVWMALLSFIVDALRQHRASSQLADLSQNGAR